MKSNFKILFLLASAGTLGWLGCQAKAVPVGAYTAPVSVIDRTTVANFDSASVSVNINPMLFEVGTPGNVLKLPGSVHVVNNFANFENASLAVVGPGANNTPMACHVTGIITDPGTGVYPAVDLQAPMEWGDKYNMSFFSGVRFYYNISNADTVSKRVFEIPTFQTQGTPAGGCDVTSGKCYDHFGTTLAGTNGSWKSFSVKFSDLTRAGFGTPLNPANLSGYNLTQVLWLLWEESNNNTAGTVTVDFWVDEIEFFQ